MDTNLSLVSPNHIKFAQSVRLRNVEVNQHVEMQMGQGEYNLLLNAGMFDKPTEISNPPPFKAIGLPNDIVEVSYNVPHWEMFENNVWKLFVQLGSTAVNFSKFAVNLDGSSYFGANGIFIGTDLAFVCKTMYKAKSNGLDTSTPSFQEDVKDWMSNFSASMDFLQHEFIELEGKRIVPLVVTRGYKISQREKNDLKSTLGVYIINDRFVQELDRIAGKNGQFASTVLNQELFRGEALPYDVPPFNALMETIDGARVYSFFASAKEVVDTMYVHRRLPQDTGFAMAYQRMVKPDKVANIGAYLTKSGSFFPNSIVVAVEGETFTQVEGNMGKLNLPNVYGNMWIIDGQHRLYGSAFSDMSKPVSICAIQGLDGLLQAEQFTSINSNQTKVSGDLIWDLKGELYRDAIYDNSGTKEVETMRREYFISNVWKEVNQRIESPLSSRIKIPSQSPNESLGLGTMCKVLDKPTIWKNNVMILGDDPAGVVDRTADLLISYLTGIANRSGPEWEKPPRGTKEKKNWILISYSMEILMNAFVDFVLYLATVDGNRQSWLSKEESVSLMGSFGHDVAEAMLNDDYGFFADEKDVRKAGNASVRREYYTDLVICLRDLYPSKYSPEFAPGVGYEDYTSLAISRKIKRRVEQIEFDLRRACVEALELEGPKKITKYLNSTYQNTIAQGLEQEKNWGDVSLFTEEKKFEYLSLSQLFEIMMKRFSKFQFTVKKSLLEQRFNDVKLIRNAIAHPRDFPSHNAKRSWIASLDQIEEWFKQMVLKENQD